MNRFRTHWLFRRLNLVLLHLERRSMSNGLRARSTCKICGERYCILIGPEAPGFETGYCLAHRGSVLRDCEAPLHPFYAARAMEAETGE